MGFFRQQRKRLQKNLRELFSFETIARGTLMTFTALTAIFNPLAPLTAHASNITDANGKSLLSKGKLHEIYAQGMNSAVGLNRFKNFELSKGEIANMHFNMEDSPETVDILVNLVNSKINIGGTLNAIRNNTIDGHLIFVTPDGLAVTQSGVINAGRFTGMVANPSHFRTLWGTDVSKFTKDFVLNNIDVNGNGDTKLYSNEKGIDIQGVINTRSGIALSGNSVKVGSDAKLIAKTNLDFTNLVNVDGVKSGITEGLKVTKGDAGDIILSANCYKTEVTPFDKVIGGNPLQRTNKAQIDMDGLIETDRDVKISATASQGVALSFIGTKLLPDIWSRISWAEANANIGGTIKAKNISVNANATTTYVDAFSLITPKLVVNKLFPSEGGLGTLKKVVNMVSKDLDLSWVYKVNSANVNIKKSADLNATNNLTLAAKADFSHDLTADLPGSSTKGINAIPLAAVTFGYYDNSAKINIDGKIEAGKDLKLTTDATTNVKQKATAKMKESTGVDSPDKGKTYVGLSIAVGNTTSEINLNRKDTINAGGNFTANATATPTIDVSSTSDLSFDDTGSIGTSFNFINDDSNVNVNVNSSINSGGKIDISAKQTISDTMAAENTLGKGDNYFAKANYNYEAWTNGYTFGEAIANRIKDKISGITYDQANNTKTAASEGFSSEAFMSLVDGSQFKAGSVGGYFGQIANTNVKIADNVKITAKNDVNINANTEINKLALSSVSSVYSANNAGKTDQSTERTISMAATVSNIRNNAKVDMGGNITSSAGSVNVNSDSKMAYNPFVKQWENIKSNFNKMADSATALKKNFVSIFKGNEDSQKKIDKINQLLKDSEAKKSAENKMSEDEYNNFVNAIDALLNEYESVKNEPAKRQEVLNKLENLDKLFKDVNGQIDAYAKEKLQTNKALELKNQGNFITRVADTVDSFVGTYNNAVKFGKAVLATVNPATYTNYYSRTESTAQNPVKADTSTYSGSVNVNLLNNRATVVGNNNLTINANKNVSVNSKADTSTVTITGEGSMLGTLSKSYGKSSGLDVNYQNVNGNALVLLGEANITGKNSVNIGSNNDLLQVSIMNGSSTAEGSNLHGMINVVTGNSNAVNLVNNSSNISAGKNLNVTANQKANAYDINGSLNLAKESSENNVGVGFTWLDIDSNSVANVVPFSTKNNSDSLQKAVNADIKNNVKLASDMAKSAGVNAPKATSKQGSLTGEIINVNANSAGNLLSIVAEGSYSTNSDSGLNKTVEGISKFGGIVSSGSKLLEKYINAPADKLNKVVGNAINPSEKPPEMKPFTDPLQRTHAPVPTDKHLSSANAIAFRWGYSNSSAILDNLNINNGGDNSQLNLLASDNSFRGAFSGSASANIFSGDKVNHASQKSFNSGVALNVGSNNVKSVLSNSTVNKSALITNVAQNSGSDVATGLSAGINSATGAGKQNAVTLDISINNSKNNVHAFQINNTVTGNNAALTNYAFNDKIQVAGGIGTHFSRGGQGGSNGSVSASYSDITNDLQSGIHGGKYSGLTAADVQAAKAQLQINSAVGLGRSSSSDNKSNEGSFTAAVAWQNNTANAFINNADITATGKGNSPVFQISRAQDTDEYKAFHHYADRNATIEIFKNPDGSYYSRDYAKETYVKSNNDYVKATDSSDGVRYVKIGNFYLQASKDSNGYYTQKTYTGSDIFVRFNDYNGGVNVLAYETQNNSSWNKYLTDRGFDLQGSDTLADDAKSAAGLPDMRSGSTNVNVAIGVNSTANLAGSIGVAFDYDSDTLSSQLANNTISASFINSDTRRNLDNINVATGVLQVFGLKQFVGFVSNRIH